MIYTVIFGGFGDDFLKSRQNNDRSQLISIWLCWLVYTCTYLGKYSYNANISLIEDDFSVSHTEAGTVLTFFALFAGAGRSYPKSPLFTGLFSAFAQKVCNRCATHNALN